jgi:hypothetical protein
VSFVFEAYFDGIDDPCREYIEVFPSIVADVGVWRHLDGVDDTVDDAPAAGFQSLLSAGSHERTR